MKLSCLPVSFFSDIVEGRLTVGGWARMGAELGLDAIDLSILFVPDHSVAAVRTLRSQIADQGMHVAMVTSYPDFTHPDREQRLRELDLEREVVEVAANLGARLVRVDRQTAPGTKRGPDAGQRRPHHRGGSRSHHR